MATPVFRVSIVGFLSLIAVLPGTPRVTGGPQLTLNQSNLDPEWNLQQHCPDLHVLRDRKGKVVWFSHEQMKQMAVVKIAPGMPARARQARVEGAVVLNLCVDTDGLPHNVWAISGHPLLIGSAVNAASRWRFKPYTVKSQPIAFAGTLRFTFSTSKGNGY